MLTTDIARCKPNAAMAATVLTGAVQMWMLYGVDLGFGLIAGFAVPAQNSTVPTLVRRQDLQTGDNLAATQPPPDMEDL